MIQSTQVSPALVLTQLRGVTDWKQLLEGGVDAIHLKAFASQGKCKELVEFIVRHPKVGQYATAKGILRLGNSFSDIRNRPNEDLANVYASQDVLVDALKVNDVLSQMLRTIDESWPQGTQAYSYKGVELHRAIARRIMGNHAEAHDDNIAKEVPDDSVAAHVMCQFGVNLYLEVPNNGGELEGWRRSLTRDEYDRLRNTEPQLKYGVRRVKIGDPDWEIKPGLGDVIIFRNSELHAIRQSDGWRTTWGFFLGYQSDEKPLLIWS